MDTSYYLVASWLVVFVGYLLTLWSANVYRKERDLWRNAVLDHLADTSIENSGNPIRLIDGIIDWQIDQATDPTINGGLKLVPIEPTPDMLAAGDGWGQFPRQFWAAMLGEAYPRIDGVPTIDLDAVAWHDIKKAASESTWMPAEYMANDWHADVVEFLRKGAPDGYAMVPIEPTEEMHEKAVNAAVALGNRDPWFPVAWKAAIKIATEKKS